MAPETHKMIAWILVVYPVIIALAFGLGILIHETAVRMKYSRHSLKRSDRKAQMAEKNVGRQIWNALHETHKFSIDSSSYARPVEGSGFALLIARRVDGRLFRRDSAYVQVRYMGRKNFSITYTLGDEKHSTVPANEAGRVVEAIRSFLNAHR